jgi:protein-disulfide isomerase/uncharacterized membrane protein
MVENERSGAVSSVNGQGLRLSYFLHMAIALGMVGIGIYMTKHFFDVRYSSDLTTGALCDVSQFFSCDKASLSSMASLFYVPLSVFGLLMGCFYLCGNIWTNKTLESTNAFLTIINLGGCILLLIYSLVSWKSLCLMCTFYYILGLGMFVVYKKWHHSSWKPSWKILLVYLLVSIPVAGAFAYNVKQKQSRQSLITQDLIQQFDQLPKIGDPDSTHSAKIHLSKTQFTDSPIRLSVFSDFQCPACKMFSDLVPQILKRYSAYVSIQYFYYPLDKTCNHNITEDFHAYACKAAFLAECLKSRFAQVHDDIFHAQESLGDKWLNDYGKKNQVTACMGSESTKEAVKKAISEGDKFSVASTPTIILNGVKIGLVPLNHLFLIFDELIARSQKTAGGN